MFYRIEDLQPDVIMEDRYERAAAIAQALPDAEIRTIDRRQVTLFLPAAGAEVVGDVSRSGFTVYLGGFDWVTYPAPPQILAKFPELAPLPQQTFSPDEAL